MDKYLKDFKVEEGIFNFFNSPKSVAIAVDVSGSTSGVIMVNQKKVINEIITGTRCEELKNTILAWDDNCNIKALDKLESCGYTCPSAIFQKLGENVHNLLITTDGFIDKQEVDKVKDKIINFKKLKNIICILFQGDVQKPSALNISVFYPFLEHVNKMRGSFYLLLYKTEKLFLLLKNIPGVCEKYSKLGKPPESYTDDTPWESIPSCEYKDIKEVKVEERAIEEGHMYLKNINKFFNFRMFGKDIFDKQKKNDFSFVCSKEFNDFMKSNIDSFIEESTNEDYNTLRNIVAEWKRGLMSQVVKVDTDNKSLELFNQLMEQKLKIEDKNSELYKSLNEQLQTLSKQIYAEINEKMKIKTNSEYVINQLISEIQEKITEEQNKILNNEIKTDFTLKNVTKVANRVKRAYKFTPIQSAENWVLKGNPVLCNECLICAREKEPMGLLMIDVSLENPNLFEYNISDFSLNDLITTGTKNTCAIPAGEFCYQCAYSMYLNEKHPITRQKIGSVLILTDPTIRDNYKMLLNAVCCSVFGCREIPNGLQILLGLFEELEKNEKLKKKKKRFSQCVYDWVHKYILFNTNGNLLDDDISNNKVLIEAMNDIVNYKVSPFIEESYFIPLRNKTLKAMDIISRNCINEIKSIEDGNEKKTKINSISNMRRLFIKTVVGKVIRICKNKINNSNTKQYTLMVYYTENDLYNNALTSVPIINSEKISNFENSKMLRNICNDEEDYFNIIKTVKYFEEYIRTKYGDKDFKLITDTMMTIISLGIYSLLNEENNINDICKMEEDSLKIFMGILKFKNKYSPEEKKIYSLNKEIFQYGNSKIITKITNDELIQLVKSIAPYSKIIMKEDIHLKFICKYGSHLYGPSVTICSVCGLSFITEEEKNSLKKSEKINEISEAIKARKYKHMKEFFYTTNGFGYDEFTNICPIHKLVRIVCNMDKFKELEKPTRELILEEIKEFKMMNRLRRGNIYSDSIMKKLTAITWDYIKRRKTLDEKHKKLLFETLTFQDRVMIEIDESQNEYVGAEANFDGLTQEEVNELTAPIKVTI